LIAGFHYELQLRSHSTLVIWHFDSCEMAVVFVTLATLTSVKKSK